MDPVSDEVWLGGGGGEREDGRGRRTEGGGGQKVDRERVRQRETLKQQAAWIALIQFTTAMLHQLIQQCFSD